MANIIKLNDGSEFEFEKKRDLDIVLIQKVANLDESKLLSLVNEAGVRFESKPDKLDVISCLDEINTDTLVKLYDKFNTRQ
jgi:hypothetical protein